MIYFGQTQGRSPQLLNRMTTYNEVDNLTKNNKGIAVLGSRVESRNGCTQARHGSCWER
ncbi:C47 family peptidase [Staphylococcus aureus]